MENLPENPPQIHFKNIPYIPDETMLKILSHIDQKNYFYFSEVCRRWKYLISAETLWRRLKFIDFYFPDTSMENQFLQNGLKFVEHGDFTGSIMGFEFLIAIFNR